MDSGVGFALALAILFLGTVIWLVVHVRGQEKIEMERHGPQESTSNDAMNVNQSDSRKREAS